MESENMLKQEDDKIIEMTKTKAFMEKELSEENEKKALTSEEFLKSIEKAVVENNKLLIDVALDKYIKYGIKIPDIISKYVDSHAVNGNYFTESFTALTKQMNKTPEEIIADAIKNSSDVNTNDDLIVEEHEEISNEIVDVEFQK
jgi:hypothetical protein